MRTSAISAITLITTLIAPFSSALSDDAQGLIGSWIQTSCIIEVIGEGESPCFGGGAGQKGILVATREGRWMAFQSATNRKPATTVEERAALLVSMQAYTGRYVVEGNKITINIEGSHTEVYTGANQQQVRFFTLDGDKLSIRTPEQESGTRLGKRVVARLTFEREH